MNGQEIIATQRRRRQFRVRNRLKSGRPRLSVFRSGRHMYAQVIDDATGKTLAAASSSNRHSFFTDPLVLILILSREISDHNF